MTKGLCWIGVVVFGLLTVDDVGGQSNITAFVHFNVVPMTSDTVLRDQTVLVADGRITAVGPAKDVPIPRSALRVDGHGSQFLLPALADMHTHSTSPAELALFASHGVLTILNMGWSPDTFVAIERLRYNSGELFGPTIFESRRMNRPYGRTSGIATVEQARDTVLYARRLGYDFIKAYSFLDDTVYDAMMASPRTLPTQPSRRGVGRIITRSPARWLRTSRRTRTQRVSSFELGCPCWRGPTVQVSRG